MVINQRGDMAGSVSAGCIESAVIQEALQVLADGRPRMLHYGVTDDVAQGVGLACGGSISVYVERISPAITAAIDAGLRPEEPLGRIVIIADQQGEARGQLLFNRGGMLHSSMPSDIAELLLPLSVQLNDQASEVAQLHSVARAEVDIGVLLEYWMPQPSLVIVGAVHLAESLDRLARELGHQTIIVDPRSAFASEERFPSADKVIVGWPQEIFGELVLLRNSAVVAISHDPKIDDPALLAAVNSPAFYVGALGSRKTHAERVKRLNVAGASGEQLQRIHAPIGLNIGAATPSEIALAIMAEIISCQRRADSHSSRLQTAS